MSLKLKFIIFAVLVVFLPLMILSTVSFSILENNMREQAFSNARSVADQTMAAFDAQIKPTEATLMSIVNSTYLRNFVSMRDMPSNHDLNSYYLALRLLNVEISNLIGHSGDTIFVAAILWADGGIPMLRTSGSSPPFKLYNDYRELELYKRSVAAPYQTHWTYVDDQANEYIALTRAIIDSRTSEVGGVVLFGLYPDALGEYVSDAGSGRSLLLDGNDRILYDSAGALTAQICPWPQITRMEDSTSGRDMELDGQGYLVQRANSGINDWRIIRMIPISEIEDEIQKMTVVVAFVVLGCLAVIVPATFIYFRMVYRPIRRLTDTMQAFGGGDISVRVEEGRSDEFGMLYTNYNEMANSIEAYIQEIHTQQEQRQELEIKFLHAQIMPHFLVNTLTSIKTLARRGRLDQVGDMVISLISLLRMVNSPALMVSVEDELRYAEDYIEIMKVRYQLPIRIVKDIDEAALRMQMPKFLLQPLMENSVIHGFHFDIEDPTIYMEAKVEGAVLKIALRDNGCGMDEATLKRLLSAEGATDANSDRLKFSKIGVNNVGERIRLRYGDQYGMVIKSQVGVGTKTVLTLPAILEKKGKLPDGQAE